MRSIGASLTIALLLATGAPVVAQPVSTEMLREVRAIDQLFSEAERARLNGDCQTRNIKMNDLVERIRTAETHGMFGPDAINAFHRRFAEATAKDLGKPRRIGEAVSASDGSDRIT